MCYGNYVFRQIRLFHYDLCNDYSCGFYAMKINLFRQSLLFCFRTLEWLCSGFYGNEIYSSLLWKLLVSIVVRCSFYVYSGLPWKLLFPPKPPVLFANFWMISGVVFMLIRHISVCYANDMAVHRTRRNWLNNNSGSTPLKIWDSLKATNNT